MIDFPSVSIVIPAFNEETYIRDCLDSVILSDYPAGKREIIVVDNGSTDSTLAIVNEYNVKLLIKSNVKVGAVRNYGAREASGEIIVFLDADCVVTPGWLKAGVSKLCDDAAKTLGGQYLLRDSPSWLEKYWVLNSSEQVHQTTLVGGVIFIKKESFLSAGGFDENLTSGEDSELTYRLRSLGQEVAIIPSLSVVHLGYPSTVRAFVKRQIWHSADYALNFPDSLKDKVFILTLLFLLGILLLVIGGLSNQLILAATGVALTCLMPGVLSTKRIVRSGRKFFNPKDLAAIYLVDVLYLVGRSFGVINGFFARLRRASNS